MPFNLKNDPAVDAAFSALPQTMAINEFGYDSWGFNPKAAKLYYGLAHLIYRYFRPRIVGIENVPKGRVLIVPNHSGQLPFDAVVVAVACLLEAQPPRVVRAMAERWVPTLPLVNIAFSRSGVVVGDPTNCKNLLEAENAILVFPEGTRGSGKTFWERYQLQQFGRGFIRLALQTNTPIVPVGVVGAEESIVSVANLKRLAKLLKAPYVPVPALLPLLGPLAFMPLPTKFHVYFGEPIQLTGRFDDEDDVIEQKAQFVQSKVAELIAKGRAERQGIF